MLWIVTAFFNSDVRRLAHYRTFVRAIAPLPVLTVELAFDLQPFQLSSRDADRLLQIRGDRMWQKERCVNVGLAELPSDCDAVVIIDSDVLIQGNVALWGERVSAALSTCDLIQPYSSVEYLQADGSVDFSWPSVAAAGKKFLPPIKSPEYSTRGIAHGIAWAARREFLRRVGVYDTFVAGGGDTSISFAAHGVAEQLPAWFNLSPAHGVHYMEWARKFISERGDASTVPYVDQVVQHLYHGSLISRRHKERKGLLHHFDPAADLIVNATGGFTWAPHAGDAQRAVQQHFAARDSEA
jgi:hypothetical protein